MAALHLAPLALQPLDAARPFRKSDLGNSPLAAIAVRRVSTSPHDLSFLDFLEAKANSRLKRVVAKACAPDVVQSRLESSSTSLRWRFACSSCCRCSSSAHASASLRYSSARLAAATANFASALSMVSLRRSSEVL